MSSSLDEEPVKRAVPLADLSIIDRALAADDAGLRDAVKRVRPADLGRDLSRRSFEDSARIFNATEDRYGAALLRAAHPAVAGKILTGTPAARAARVLGFLATDHEVEILANVEPEQRAHIEAAMDPGDKQTVTRLLAQDALAVGRLMTPKIWRARPDQTVEEALAILRKDREDIEVAVNLYVVEGDRLVGVTALREVTVAPSTSKLADIMTRDPIAVRDDTPRGDAADIIRAHDFLSLPVVDAEGRLVGAVRVDDVLDAVLDKVGDGFLNQGAIAGKIAARAPYFLTPITRTVRSRLTWLVLLFVAETLTGTVLRHFEGELARVVALSFFVPLLIGTGGNAGSQTVATVIRAAALGEVRTSDVGRVVLRELTAGLLLGLLLAGIAFGRALLWGVGAELALCVAVTIFVVVIWANLVGATIPLAAQRVGIDPTVISGPLITTLVDATGLFIYFTVAHLTIAQLHEEPRKAVTYDCAVVEVRARQEIALSKCDAERPAPPCWRIADPDDKALGIAVDHGDEPVAPDTTIRTHCANH